jgi:hemerythrin superfamily protein
MALLALLVAVAPLPPQEAQFRPQARGGDPRTRRPWVFSGELGPNGLGIGRPAVQALRASERKSRPVRTLAGGGFMDAIALLTRDHQEVDRLFKQFEKLTERAQKSKKKLVLKMVRELAIHAAIEEMLFYPAVRTAALKASTRAGQSAADTVLESLEEHHIVKWTLSELEKMSPEDERFDAKVTVLMESVRHHVEEENDELFPKARKLLGAEMLEELGQRMEKAKKIAPTRPHPRSPDSPPGNIVAGTMAAVMDRGRDMVRGAAEKMMSRRPAGQTDA